MNTKTDGISSGLVAVAEVAFSHHLGLHAAFVGRRQIEVGDKLVRLSDAEAIINDLQNLVVAENQRKQQLEEERDTWKERAEFSYAQRDKQAERIKELEAVIEGFKQDQEEMIANEVKQSAALKLARQVLMSVKETSSSTRLRRIVDEPLAAIHEVLKGE